MSSDALILTDPSAGAFGNGTRLGFPFLGAVLITLLLFWFMQILIAPPDEIPRPPDSINTVQIVQVQPEDDSVSEEASSAAPPAAPPPPSLPSLSNLTIPVQQAPSVNVSMPTPQISADVGIGQSFGKAFGGFGTAGSGSGNDGYGSGKGFKGKPLVPLSTARPQIPESAYRRGIEGWVEVVFTVTGEGRVVDIKIIDAQPKGIFEAAALESIAEWIYPRYEKGGKPIARQVKQRVEFKLEDYQYNWN